MHQATVRGFDTRSGFAWLDACNRKPKAELLRDAQKMSAQKLTKLYKDGILITGFVYGKDLIQTIGSFKLKSHKICFLSDILDKELF